MNNSTRTTEYKIQRMTLIAKFFYRLGVTRLYHNGDVVDSCFRWWHPISWVAVPVLFVGLFLMGGLPAIFSRSYLSAIGIGVDPYFKDHPDKLEWIN